MAEKVKTRLEYDIEYMQNSINADNIKLQSLYNQKNALDTLQEHLLSKYDYDGDGTISIIDLSIIQGAILGYSFVVDHPLFNKEERSFNSKSLDINLDNNVNATDVNSMVNIILHELNDIMNVEVKTYNSEGHALEIIDEFYSRNDRLPSLDEFAEISENEYSNQVNKNEIQKIIDLYDFDNDGRITFVDVIIPIYIAHEIGCLFNGQTINSQPNLYNPKTKSYCGKRLPLDVSGNIIDNVDDMIQLINSSFDNKLEMVINFPTDENNKPLDIFSDDFITTIQYLTGRSVYDGSWVGPRFTTLEQLIVYASDESSRIPLIPKNVHYKLISTNEQPTYDITINSNGGSSAIPPKYLNKVKNTSIILPDAPSRPGYKFVCWNTSKDGTGISYEAKSVYIIKGTQTLWAQWSEIPTQPNTNTDTNTNTPDFTQTPSDTQTYPWTPTETPTFSPIPWTPTPTPIPVTIKYIYFYDADKLIHSTTLASNIFATLRVPRITKFGYTLIGYSTIPNSNHVDYTLYGDYNYNNFGLITKLYACWAVDPTQTDGPITPTGTPTGTDTDTNTNTPGVTDTYYFTLRIDPNGGPIPAQTIFSNIEYGQSVVLPQIPTRAGYIFVGYNTMKDGNGKYYYVGEQFKVTYSRTLYAYWVPVGTYPVTPSQSVTPTPDPYDFTPTGTEPQSDTPDHTGTETQTQYTGTKYIDIYIDGERKYREYVDLGIHMQFIFPDYRVIPELEKEGYRLVGFGTRANANIVKYTIDRGYNYYDFPSVVNNLYPIWIKNESPNFLGDYIIVDESDLTLYVKTNEFGEEVFLNIDSDYDITNIRVESSSLNLFGFRYNYICPIGPNNENGILLRGINPGTGKLIIKYYDGTNGLVSGRKVLETKEITVKVVYDMNTLPPDIVTQGPAEGYIQVEREYINFYHVGSPQQAITLSSDYDVRNIIITNNTNPDLIDLYIGYNVIDQEGHTSTFDTNTNSCMIFMSLKRTVGSGVITLSYIENDVVMVTKNIYVNVDWNTPTENPSLMNDETFTNTIYNVNVTPSPY